MANGQRLTRPRVVDLSPYGLMVALMLCMLALAPADTSAGGNRLQNPGFEGSFGQYGPYRTAVVATGWTPWWRPQSRADPAWRSRMPEYKTAAPYKNRIHSGHNAQQLFTAYGTHIGGIYQTVDEPDGSHGIEPGSTIRFTVWGHAWAGSGDNPYQSESGGPMHMAVGIDPAGGTSPFSSRVVWSKDLDPLDEWVQFEVEARAVSSAVTVFTRSAPEFPTQHNDVYWDDAELVVVRPAPTPTTTPRAFFAPVGSVLTAVPTPSGRGSPSPAQAGQTHTAAAPSQPTPSPVPNRASGRASTQAAPTATPTFTVPNSGSICVTVYEDRNANRRWDEGESSVAGANLVLEGESWAAREFPTTDTGQPHCFSDLQAGIYYLTMTAPPGYRSFEGNVWQVWLGEQNARIVIGLRETRSPAWPPTQAKSSSSAPQRPSHELVPWIAFLTVGGAIAIIGLSVARRR